MPDAAPVWGNWVNHVDSTGQAASISLTPNTPANTVATILFDRMVLSLSNDDPGNLAGSVGLAGHIPLTLPDEYPLAGYLLLVRGVVIKTFDASALLTGSIGEKGFAQEWPRTAKSVAVGSGDKPGRELVQQDFVISCFTADQHAATGDPPTFPPVPPLTLALMMQARRPSIEAAIEFHVDSLDISILK